LRSVLSKPRPMVQVGDYYGPKPRNNVVVIEQPYVLPTSAELPRLDQQGFVSLDDRDICESGDNSKNPGKITLV
jgi:hypothetical protein